MGLPRSILFVDGENLTFRYQDSIANGRQPIDDVIHARDIYVWHPRLADAFRLEKVVRVYYYTSVVGDEQAIANVKRQLSEIVFGSRGDDGGMYGKIVPVVFKKPAKSHKSRNVDIQIVIDVMRFAFTDEIDRVYLASGDGDYLPLITEVMRRGKQVEILAFSSGLNDGLTYSVDNFFCLDSAFFKRLF